MDKIMNTKEARLNDVIIFDYFEKLSDGSIINQASNKKVKLGHEELNKSIEVHIVGMEEGEKKKIKLPPHKSYGNYNEKLVFKVNKTKFKNNQRPTVGHRYKIKLKNGGLIHAKIIDIDNQKVIFDANHELAGKEILYEIHLRKIVRN
ncbi:MAG: FKBP-type peptidyl-prolyl cis-trans isomerase [bacterium]|nr:FKBP-type peptidyl-prolyl cis-trans isomerase [bacterium]